ncbi:NAD(P)H-dependent oxidoreductase [Paenibacillus sp. JW14]|uniref:NAD(P)H-dependent oxidoreductase n=1 Tax=Paenibacillus agri TaxID=2744309 RepID=A0A850ERS8_9BACL|nr:NAD(P)H-dependent oxidoreductase [Paenibacillus agri]
MGISLNNNRRVRNETLEHLLSPFETTFKYCGADYRSFYAFYGTESEYPISDLEKSVQDYLNFIDNL